MEKNIVVPLSPLDNVMAHCYAKFLLCLSLKPNQSFRSVGICLQTSLSMTVAQWPIHRGTVGLRQPGPKDWKAGQLEVRLPKQERKNSLFPLVLTDLSAKIKYGALRDSGFPEEELDGKKFLSGAFGLDLENGLDVMVAQANFLEGGCLLRLGIWHCVSNAYGAYNLLESWSENCRKVQKQDGWVWAEMTTPAGLDRETLTRLWLEETAEPCSHAEIMKEEDSWRLLGLNPPMDSHESQEEEEENYVSGSKLGNVSTAPHEMKTCVFYVSASSFKNLRHAASVNDVKISGNDAVSALLWRSIMAARFPETTLDHQKTKAYLDMLLDGRSHFSSKLPTSYLGNVVFFSPRCPSLFPP